MWIKNKFIDLNELTLEEVNNALAELKVARARKSEARARKDNLRAMVENMKEEGLTFCSMRTGEVFDPDEWLVYDEQSGATYEGKWSGT